MANAGRVELDLVAIGKDEVSAMLRKVEAQARQMSTGMKEAGAATGGLGAKLEGLKASVQPLEKVRNTFENLRSNAMFVVGGLGALAGAFVALTEAVSSNAAELRRWEDVSKKIYEGIGKPPALLDEIAEFLGEKVTTPGMKLVDKIRSEVGDLDKQIEEAKTGAAALQKAYDAVVSGGQKAGELDAELANKRNGALTALAILEQDRERLLLRQEEVQKRITKELEDQGRLSKGVVDDIREILDKAARAAAGAWMAVGGQGLAARLFGKGTGTGVQGAPKPPRGGRGGGESFEDWMGRESANWWAQLLAANEARGYESDPMFDVVDGAPDMGGFNNKPTGLLNAAERAASFAKLATNIERVANAFEHVATALGSVSDAFPEVTASFNELNQVTERYAAERAGVEGKLNERLAQIREMNLSAADEATKEKEAQDKAAADSQASLNRALAAGGVAIAANAAKAIGGVRAEAAVRAAYEVGMGFATLANPIESAGHFTAAALLGAVAAGAGRGGGGSAGGGSRASSSSGGGSGGPTTIVYNFSSLVTDQQQVTTALRRATRSSRGTGHESRAGV